MTINVNCIGKVEPRVILTFDFWWLFQELLGPVPEGYDDYFASRFPKLLIEVYKVACKHGREEKWFQKYF